LQFIHNLENYINYIHYIVYVILLYIFQKGRTNKLVDGCYSLWQGGVFPLIHHVLKKQNDQALSNESWMFDQGEPESHAEKTYRRRQVAGTARRDLSSEKVTWSDLSTQQMVAGTCGHTSLRTGSPGPVRRLMITHAERHFKATSRCDNSLWLVNFNFVPSTCRKSCVHDVANPN
jgi:hypothetical protein